MSELTGLLNINKPAGFTSHDVVGKVRRLCGIKKVGHTGTLDPQATGVLILCLGKATRIASSLFNLEKEYEAELTFGTSTDTQDAWGKVIEQVHEVRLTRASVEETLKDFTGEIFQVPPMVSAVHYQGKRLYELARLGKVVERPARKIKIFDLKLLDFETRPVVRARLRVQCSKGTYVRTLCADIGAKLGVPAHQSSLVRTRVGPFSISDSVAIDQLEKTCAEGNLASVLIKISDVLKHASLAQQITIK